MDDLLDAIAAAGLQLPRPPSTLDGLHELEAEIAPRHLPEGLRAFWQAVDVPTLPIVAFPRLTGPEWATQSLRDARDNNEPVPVSFVSVGYESWNCMSVDVDDGAVYDWRLDTDAFWRRFDRFEDWLSHVARLIRAGSVTPQGDEGDICLLIEDPDDDLAMSERGYPEVPRKPTSWPARWRA